MQPIMTSKISSLLPDQKFNFQGEECVRSFIHANDNNFKLIYRPIKSEYPLKTTHVINIWFPYISIKKYFFRKNDNEDLQVINSYLEDGQLDSNGQKILKTKQNLGNTGLIIKPEMIVIFL